MADLPFSEYYEKNGFVFVSGQVHLDSEGNLVGDTIQEKTKKTMENVEAVLVKAGIGFSNVVITNIYLTDISNFKEVNEVYVSFLKKPYPARVTIGVAALPLGAEIEIAVIASKK